MYSTEPAHTSVILNNTGTYSFCAVRIISFDLKT